MPELTWFTDWHANVAALQPWLAPLLGVAVVAFALFGALVRRHARSGMRTSAMPQGRFDETGGSDVPEFLRQRAVHPPPQRPLSLSRTGHDETSHDVVSASTGGVHDAGDNAAKDIASEFGGDDRTAGWRPLYPYLKHRRFTTWKAEDLTASVEEEACPLAIKLFISHRWQTPDDPDPKMTAVATIIEYLSRIYMTANNMLDTHSFVARELVAGDGLRRAFEKRSLERCTCGSAGWLDVRSLLPSGDIFLTRVDQASRRDFYRLLKHVRVWYDYASLPQARVTPEERAAFDRAFSRLSSVVARSDVLALWGLESINRAWCLFEVLAGRNVHFCAPTQAKHNPELEMMFKAFGYPDLADYQGRPSISIMIHVNEFRAAIAGKDPQAIERYLRERHIDCTLDEDFGRVAGLIHQNLTR